MLTDQFNNLVNTYGSRLYSLAYRLTSNRHTAEDAVQDTFKSVWKTKKQIAEGSEFPLLMTILKRRIFDISRSSRGRGHSRIKIIQTTSKFNDIPYFDDPPNDNLSINMQEALNELDEKIRETFLLVTVGDLKHIEAAKLQNVPIGTILSRVSRARNSLRKILKKDPAVVV